MMVFRRKTIGHSKSLPLLRDSFVSIDCDVEETNMILVESESHFYSVFKGHASEKSFIKMYESPVSLFSADLPDMYTMAEGMNVK